MILEVNFKKIFFLFIFLNISCDFEPNYKLFKGSTFGTYYQVKFFEVDKNYSTIEKEIDSIFDHFNSSLSTYISSSTISKVNRNEKVIVDDLFIDIFCDFRNSLFSHQFHCFACKIPIKPINPTIQELTKIPNCFPKCQNLVYNMICVTANN